MKYFVIAFFVLSLLQVALLQNVNDQEENSSATNEDKSPASVFRRAMYLVRHMFDENDFPGGISGYQQQLTSFIIKNLNNNPDLIESLERVKGKIIKMATELKSEEDLEALLQTI